MNHGITFAETALPNGPGSGAEAMPVALLEAMATERPFIVGWNAALRIWRVRCSMADAAGFDAVIHAAGVPCEIEIIDAPS